MPKFFMRDDQMRDDKVHIVGSDYIHIKTVLRAAKGDELILCNGAGQDFLCNISCITDAAIVAEVIKTLEDNAEPSVKITLFQGLPKLDKMELIIQKCVELGVHEIIPMSTARSIVKLSPTEERSEKKINRWQKIAEAAAKQSGRGLIPRVGGILSFRECLSVAESLDTSIIPYEREQTNSLRGFCKDFCGNHIGIFIGPEGGFDAGEIDAATKRGIIPINLGKRILRTETAGFYTLSILMYELED